MRDGELIVEPDGSMRFIYDDALAAIVRHVGAVEIRRASNVEPDGKGWWWADMAPVGGPKLGPFIKRTVALDAEVAWLVGAGVPFPVPA